MKQHDLHALLRRHIPQINFLETDTTEAAEGECTLWQQEDCTLIIEFENEKQPETTLITALQTIAQKLTYLDTQRGDIIKTLSTQTQTANIADANMVYVAFFVEHEDVFCDFAVSASAWHEHIAECSLEKDNELIFNGLEKL